MADLFASGSLIDIILCFVAVEALLLACWLKIARRGPRFSAIAGNLVAGFSLLATVRLAIAGAWWGWMALFLAASLVAHVFDMWMRFSRTEPAPQGKGISQSPPQSWPAQASN